MEPAWLLEVELAGGRYDMTEAKRELPRRFLPTGRPGPTRKHDCRFMDEIFFDPRAGRPVARPAQAERPVHELL